MKTPLFIFFGIIFSLTTATAQEINQMDDAGKRHGIWQKTFEGTNQLRYEGQFDHGVEIGVFKFYCSECGKQPMVIKEYSGKKGLADVKYYTKKGKLVSEGKMLGKKRIGEWLYYQKRGNAVMTREFYTEGELNGVKTTYYPNGKITEELNFQNGLKEGANNYYSPEGVLLKKLQYRNDKLQGAAEYYDSNGNVSIKGQYLKGKKNGLWQYLKDGKVELEETYPKPVKRG